jgi:hypothetical protein
MWNRKKTQGIILAAIGVFFARIDLFAQVEKTMLLSLNAVGMAMALTGIALYASGMPRTLKRAKACPFCYAKNAVTARTCKQCRKELPL